MKAIYFFLLPVLFVPVLFAQIPRTISYQGVLTDNAGNPKPDGSYTISFNFYESETGGDAIWSESKTLNISNGLFSTSLGDQVIFGSNVKFDKPYWLGIKVGSEAELSPRIALTSAGYSLSSNTALDVIDGKVVKSLNNLKDNVTLEGSGGTTINTSGDTIIISSSGGGGTGIQGIQNTNNTLDITDPNGPTATVNVKIPLTLNGAVPDGSPVFSSTVANGTTGWGVMGNSPNGTGIVGFSENWTGVYGQSNASTGVWGKSVSGTGVYGETGTWFGLWGKATGTNGKGVLGESATSFGVWGISPNSAGVVGESDNWVGVYGETEAGNGVWGKSGSGYGVYGEGNIGVGGTGYDNGVKGISANMGVYGDGGLFGVYGEGLNAAIKGVGTYVGIWGECEPGDANYAGWFVGNVHVNGTLSKSAGSFKIDHPLDPTNKYLSHSFVESPDMKNIYDGVVVTDANGFAEVKLPSYFDVLNINYRYQLTTIGQQAQTWIESEIQNNRFTIRSDKPKCKSFLAGNRS